MRKQFALNDFYFPLIGTEISITSLLLLVEVHDRSHNTWT